MDTTTVVLPRILYPGDDTENNTRNTYGKNSLIEVRYADDRLKTFRLDNRNGLLRIGDELTKDGIEDEIKGYTVEGLRYSDSMEGSYVFGVTFSNPGQVRMGIYSLAVPCIESGAKAFNKDLLMWIFNYHEGIEDPSSEMIKYLENFGEQALASELSRIIAERFPQPLS